MNKQIRGVAIIFFLFLSGCLYEPYESTQIKEFKSNYHDAKGIGQARFMFDDMNTLTLKSLMDVRVMPVKVYETALLLAHKDEYSTDSKNVPAIMEKYGFVRVGKVANWNGSPEKNPKPEVLGYVSGYVEKEVMGVNFKLQTGTITCAACHTGRTYTAEGIPTNDVWLGSSNSSINFDSYLDKIYQGLKIAAQDKDAFLNKIKLAYPDADEVELATIKNFILPKIKTEIKKMAKMDRVLPFSNGGPGNTNGLSSFKRAAKLHKDPYQLQEEELGFISVPDLSYRKFRSSLLADGAYGIKGQTRYREVNQFEANSSTQVKAIAQLAAFFTFSAMGNTLVNVESIFPNVEEIFSDFLENSTPQRFPGELNMEVAEAGKSVFNKSCSKCHGVFDGPMNDLRLVSYPNKFVPFEKIGTDNYRWASVDKKIRDFANSNKVISKYVETFSPQRGYVAPILSGLWATAPYLHNGSVPDLWSFMNPELRPKTFKVGGHALSFEKMGISYPAA